MSVRPSIAVVEDSPDNRLLVHAILGDRYELVDYDNGSDAVAGVLADPPDLVLLDISLPVMDGSEVLARIRASAGGVARLPVIALTAHAMTGDRERYLAAGFDEYVSKPIVDEAVLIDAIERLIRRAT